MKTKNFKIFLGQYILVIALLLFPKSIFAEEVNVVVRTGSFGMDATTVAELTADSNTAKVADLKQDLASNHNVNFDNYVLSDSNFNTFSDSLAICTEGMNCYQTSMGENLIFSTTIYLVPLDSTKKEISINSIPPVDESMFRSLYQANYDDFDGLGYKSCNDSFTTCVFSDHKGFKIYNNVQLKYNYDAGIKSLAEKIVAAGLLNKTTFKLTDTEMINYINYGGGFANYSSEFKNQLSNLNFSFEMDPRGGAFDPFRTAQIGFYKFLYKNTLYAVKDSMEVYADHVIYVPTDTTDVKKAIEDRLNQILGDENFITVEESMDTINDYLTNFGFNTVDYGNEKYYILISNNENAQTNGMDFIFRAVKDSSKINNNVSFKSSDLVTEVSVSTTSSVPLDTLVNVSKVSSGEEYEKIKKALDKEGETFDITLYSDAQDKRVTKLDNGKFLVSIPVSDDYEGKDLKVYYVSEDGKVEEHEVTLVKENGKLFATFETDHFSMYTLVNNGVSLEANPKTGDNIILYVVILSISLVIAAGLYVYSKKRRK